MRKTELNEKIALALENRQKLEKNYNTITKVFDECKTRLEKLINENTLSDFPFSVGFKWTLKADDGKLEWVLVEDENGKGTYKNPFEFISGVKCYALAHYTHNGRLYMCLKSGIYKDTTGKLSFLEIHKGE